jgi:hypothetical protein
MCASIAGTKFEQAIRASCKVRWVTAGFAVPQILRVKPNTLRSCRTNYVNSGPILNTLIKRYLRFGMTFEAGPAEIKVLLGAFRPPVSG